jgi:starch synthase
VQEFDPSTGTGNGFLFGPSEPSALLQAIDRALVLFHRKKDWATVMRNAMAADFSWDRSARVYLDLYRRLLGR